MQTEGTPLDNQIKDILKDITDKSLVKSGVNNATIIADVMKTGEIFDLLNSTGVVTDANVKNASKEVDKTHNGNIIKNNMESIIGLNNDVFRNDIESRKKFYDTYRFILRNIPQLSTALNVLTNQIVSPDRILDDVIKITGAKGSIDESTTTNEKHTVENIIKRYKLNDNIFSYISSALSDGECFLELIKTTNIKFTDNVTNEVLLESVNDTSELVKLLEENASFRDNDIKLSEETKKHLTKTINDKFLVGSFDLETEVAVEALINEKETELLESVADDTTNSVTENKESELCYIKKHKPEHVVKLQVDNIELGYILVKDIGKISVQDKNFYETFVNDDSRKTKEASNLEVSDIISTYILDKIVGRIDTKNKKILTKLIKSNEDLYNLVKMAVGNDTKVNIRFIDKDQMQHFKNPARLSDGEVYGESFLNPLLLFIKHYLAVLMANTNYNLTRAVERRLIKVEVGSDMDAESSLIEVVKKLKQREEAIHKNMSSLESMTTELSPTDDVYLPTINGEAPITFDAIPASQSSLDPEYLNQLKEEILKGLSVPRSLLNEYTNSYHTSLAQENFVFAFEIILYQNKFSPQVTELIRKLNLLESGKNKQFNNIKVGFSPPVALMNEQRANELGHLDQIFNFFVNILGDESGVIKVDKIKLMKMLSSHFEWDKIDDLVKDYEIAKVAKIIKEKSTGDTDE